MPSQHRSSRRTASSAPTTGTRFALLPVTVSLLFPQPWRTPMPLLTSLFPTENTATVDVSVSMDTLGDLVNELLPDSVTQSGDVPLLGNDYTATLHRGAINLHANANGIRGKVRVGGKLEINNLPDITNIRADVSVGARPQLTTNWGIETDEPQINVGNVHWEVLGLNVDWLDGWMADVGSNKLEHHMPALNQALSHELRNAADAGWQALCKDVELDDVEAQIRIRPASVQAQQLVFDAQGVTLTLTIGITIQVNEGAVSDKPCPPLPEELILAP